MSGGTGTRTLGDLVTEAPARAEVFERLGLDYCCHGGRTLEQACSSAGLDPTRVVADIETLDQLAPADGAEAGAALPLEPAALTQYIEALHHAYLHAELPELDALAEK